MRRPEPALLASRLHAARPLRVQGRVVRQTGLVLEAALPGVRAGEVVTVEAEPGSVRAEVVGFTEERVRLLPFGELRGVGPESRVTSDGERFSVRVGEGLVGRVLDGLGRPLDGRPLPGTGLEAWEVDRDCPPPATRACIERPLPLGIRCIDALVTLGEGQRLGVFAGPGVGKSTLLGQAARAAAADVAVIGLIGERGRELREFLDDALGEEGLRRSVVVCATSDQPALVRLKAAFVATAIAEWFREQGASVLFLLDSITRAARAQREVGLAAGEPPVRHGYPPSVFSLLPRLLERTGNSERGRCTALYACLVPGGDLDEPIADEVRSILDGHLVLSRAVAERDQWPAVDVLQSLSRVMPRVTTPAHRTLAARLRRLLAAHESNRDLILLGAYRAGSDPWTDEALRREDGIRDFLRQSPGERAPFDETLARLEAVLAG